MARRVASVFLLLAPIAAAAALSAQDVFRAATDLILLSISTAREPRGPGGLDQEDFRVYEDGRLQDITVFQRDPRPIALSILMDASASMEPRLGIAQDAAVAFCRRMQGHDVTQFMTFNASTEVKQTFTADVALLEKAIRSTQLSNQTALYTAMYVALSDLNTLRSDIGGVTRRKALILVSDGEDTSSIIPYEQVVDRAKRSDVTVFAIAFRPPNAVGYSDYNYALRAITQATGGRVFFVLRTEELPAVYDEIANELASQYTLGYVSKNTAKDGTWRSIKVQVSEPGVVARTREGYYAPTAPAVR